MYGEGLYYRLIIIIIKVPIVYSVVLGRYFGVFKSKEMAMVRIQYIIITSGSLTLVNIGYSHFKIYEEGNRFSNRHHIDRDGVEDGRVLLPD